MAKSLKERIAERVNQEPTVKRASGKVAFLALKDEIAQAVRAGWPVKEIWITLHEEGRIAVGYHTFNRYVNKHIRASEVPLAAVSEPPTPKPPEERAQTGFRFNSSPKKEDIV